MHDNGFEAYQLKQGDILNDVSLQFLVAHGASAILYHNDFTVEFLDIGQGFNKHRCFLHYLIHFFLFHFPSSLSVFL